ELRLVNGPNSCSGRVEVMHDHQWGTICDDDWNFPDASVVCRQLGCGAAVSAYGAAHFGQGSGPIWLDNVRCHGNEAALSECLARPWGDNNCNHGEDASIVLAEQEEVVQRRSICMNMLLAPFTDADTSGQRQLRLVNGSNSCLGRVEVFHNQKWGTVCDDTWDLHDATVVCRQLGCGVAVSAPSSAHFGPGSDPIWLDGTHCTGSESALTECDLSNWGEHNCGHSEDAGVICSGAGERWAQSLRRAGGGALQRYVVRAIQLCTISTPAPLPAVPAVMHNHSLTVPLGVPADSSISTLGTLQLLNGPNRCAGRVEVLHNHMWGTICDDGWDLADAAVVCRQLGCGTALSATTGALFGRGHDPIWLDEVNCTGTEDTLFDCRARAWGENNCFHGEDAGVVCSVGGARDAFLTQGSQHAAPSPYFPLLGNSEGDQVRLLTYGSRCAGRVEIFHNKRWGTVCDDNWDLLDAEVVCRQLDCGRALSAPGGAQFGRGDGIIWMDETNCTGMESMLSSCRARPWGINNCYHGEDAGVVC
ncbi:Deleted in malignant brain tumors 1 protein, partial [Podiceps cristatus]